MSHPESLFPTHPKHSLHPGLLCKQGTVFTICSTQSVSWTCVRALSYGNHLASLCLGQLGKIMQIIQRQLAWLRADLFAARWQVSVLPRLRPGLPQIPGQCSLHHRQQKLLRRVLPLLLTLPGAVQLASADLA